MNEPVSANTYCPHCGSANFAISAYCQRCERPLNQTSTVSVPADVLPPAPLPRPTPRAAPDASSASEKAPTALPPKQAPKNDVLILQPAPRWRVLLASLIDVTLLLGVALTVTWTELALRGEAFESRFRSPFDVVAEWLYTHGDAVLHGAGVALALGFLMGLPPGARTLGRWLTGLVVVRSSGRPYTVWVLLLRAFGLLLTTATLGLGFLWALFDPARRAWHDIVSGTVAVPVVQDGAQRFSSGSASNA